MGRGLLRGAGAHRAEERGSALGGGWSGAWALWNSWDLGIGWDLEVGGKNGGFWSIWVRGGARVAGVREAEGMARTGEAVSTLGMMRSREGEAGVHKGTGV